MISVPEAGTLPSTSRPIWRSNGSMISGGKPFGYSGKGSVRTIPAISQCPVVVSLPAERSVRRPRAVPGRASGSTPAIVVSMPRPRAPRFGARIPPTAEAVLPSVSEPASPYACASGASPTPKESQTRIRTRGTLDSVRPTTATSAALAQPGAVDVQDRPRERLEPIDRDRVPAALAYAVGSEVHLRERAVHPSQVRPQRLHHREQASAFGGRVCAVGEPALDVDRGVVGVRIPALIGYLLAQVLALLLERLTKLGEPCLVDHAVTFLPRTGGLPLTRARSLLEPPGPPLLRARGCEVK